MFETDLLSYIVVCEELKTHGYSLYEINNLMPWHLDLITECLKQRNTKPPGIS